MDSPLLEDERYYVNIGIAEGFIMLQDVPAEVVAYVRAAILDRAPCELVDVKDVDGDIFSFVFAAGHIRMLSYAVNREEDDEGATKPRVLSMLPGGRQEQGAVDE